MLSAGMEVSCGMGANDVLTSYCTTISDYFRLPTKNTLAGQQRFYHMKILLL